MGDNGQLKQKTGLDLKTYLANPQHLNSYSYSFNNPLVYRDNDGNFAFLIPAAVYAAVYAPVWAPAAITTVSAIGAGVASWFMGESVGYMMEGDHQAANQSLDKAQTTLGATAVGVGGIMAASSVINSQTGLSNSTKSQSIKLNSQINITDKGMKHVNKYHVDLNNFTSKSKFNPGIDAEKLIKSGTQQPMRLQDNNNYIRVFDTGKNIGLDRNIGNQTSYMTIVTNKNNDLITAFPGR